MSGVIQAILSTTHDRHDDMRNLVRGLPAGGLTWSPGGGAPALAGLVLHVLDVERYLAAVVMGRDIGWVGATGSRIDEEGSETELIAAIDDMDRRLKAGLEPMTGEELKDPAPGGTQSVGEALVEDLDHVATHLGQMQLTRHLYEVSHPAAPAPTSIGGSSIREESSRMSEDHYSETD